MVLNSSLQINMHCDCNWVKQTGKGIGPTGAVELSHALMMNTTITELTIKSEESTFDDIIEKTHLCSDDSLGVEGSKAICELLKKNTTLATIYLEGFLPYFVQSTERHHKLTKFQQEQTLVMKEFGF